MHVVIVAILIIVFLVTCGLSTRQRSGSFWGKNGRAPWPTKEEWNRWRNRRG